MSENEPRKIIITRDIFEVTILRTSKIHYYGYDKKE